LKFCHRQAYFHAKRSQSRLRVLYQTGQLRLDYWSPAHVQPHCTPIADDLLTLNAYSRCGMLTSGHRKWNKLKQSLEMRIFL